MAILKALVRWSLLLLVLPGLSVAQPSTKTPDQYWADTGITLQDYIRQVVPHCYESAAQVAGCLAALNLFAYGAGAYYGSPAEKSMNPLMGDRKVPFSSGFGEYTYPSTYRFKTNLEFASFQKKQQSLLAKISKQLIDLHRADPTNDLPFERWIKELKPRVIQGEHVHFESAYVGEMFNAYFHLAFDPHTNIEPIEMANAQTRASSFSGIGITFMGASQKFWISEVADDSPAMKSGLKAGDQILSVNGHPTRGQNIKAVSGWLTGTLGTSVRLEVLRQREKIEISMVRATIVSPTVKSSVMNLNGAAYGYIKIQNFVDPLVSSGVASAILKLTSDPSLPKAGLRAWIIDLRGNLGGEIGIAVSAAASFIGMAKIASITDLKTGLETDFVGGIAPVTDLPIAILIDGNSASASEIFAGAFQDYHRAWIVGQRSYGKGTAQTLTHATTQNPSGYFRFGSYQNHRIQMKLTTHRFYLPSRRTPQLVGILPDFEVDPYPGADANAKYAQRESDEFANAFSAQSSPWIQPYPQDIYDINYCVSKHPPEKLYRQLYDAHPVNFPDFQLITAQTILGCDFALGHPPRLMEHWGTLLRY